MPFIEASIEQATIDWFDSLDYQLAFGPDLAIDGRKPERKNYQDVILPGRLQESLRHINPNLPDPVLQEAFTQLTHPSQPSLLRNNHSFHRMLVEGIPVDYHAKDGRLVSSSRAGAGL